MPSIHSLFPGLRGAGARARQAEVDAGVVEARSNLQQTLDAAASPPIPTLTERILEGIPVEALQTAGVTTDPANFGDTNGFNHFAERARRLRVEEAVDFDATATTLPPATQSPLPRTSFRVGDRVRRVRGGNFGLEVQIGNDYLVRSVDPDGIHMSLEGMTGGGTSMRHFDLVEQAFTTLQEAPFAVGNSVSISETSQYYNNSSAANPRGVGVIVSISGRDVDLAIRVHWDVGLSNNYNPHDLVRVFPAGPVPSAVPPPIAPPPAPTPGSTEEMGGTFEVRQVSPPVRSPIGLQRAVRYVLVSVTPNGTMEVLGEPVLSVALARTRVLEHSVGGRCIHILKTQSYSVIDEVVV